MNRFELHRWAWLWAKHRVWLDQLLKTCPDNWTKSVRWINWPNVGHGAIHAWPNWVNWRKMFEFISSLSSSIVYRYQRRINKRICLWIKELFVLSTQSSIRCRKWQRQIQGQFPRIRWLLLETRNSSPMSRIKSYQNQSFKQQCRSSTQFMLYSACFAVV